MKLHGEIAIKGLTNYVYDDGNSIKFPSGDISKSETVCASKSFETKEDIATPKIIGSLKQDHWILDKKNKQLTRVRMTPRKALFTPNGAKECPVPLDNISRERTTEFIDASKGGEILEDNGVSHPRRTNLWSTCGQVRPSSPSRTTHSRMRKHVPDRQQIGSSTREVSQLLSQILRRHPKKNQHHFHLP